MTPIDTNYLRDLGRIQQARSCGAQALEETPAWRAAERIDELERQLHQEDVSHNNTLEQRDTAEEMADRLAAAVMEITDRDIGEHSSANSPWLNAIEYAEEYEAEQRLRAQKQDRTDELEQENRKLHMQYAGAMGLISDMSGHLALSHPEYREPLRDQIIQAAEDWCQLSGWSGRMVGNKLVLDPPKQGGAA